MAYATILLVEVFGNIYNLYFGAFDLYDIIIITLWSTILLEIADLVTNKML